MILCYFSATRKLRTCNWGAVTHANAWLPIRRTRDSAAGLSSFQSLVAWRLSRSRVYLERRPVEWLAEGGTGAQQGELGVTQCCVGRLSFFQLGVEFVHELGSGSVTHIPQGSNHVVRARADESPGKPHQSFS